MNDYNDGLLPEPCLRLDFGFGQQYASIELGDGTGYVRVTDELRGEYYKMQRWYDDELKDALDENAKLRELCKKMMAFVEDDDACKRCGHDAECVEAADGELVLPYEGLCLMLGLFADRMRELGVEVEHE